MVSEPDIPTDSETTIFWVSAPEELKNYIEDNYDYEKTEDGMFYKPYYGYYSGSYHNFYNPQNT